MPNIPEGKRNFCQVFELPPKADLPKDFCFGGGHTIPCKMVDWFDPWPIYIEEYKESIPQTWKEVQDLLTPWLAKKRYVKEGYQYILITDWGDTLYFEGGAEKDA